MNSSVTLFSFTRREEQNELHGDNSSKSRFQNCVGEQLRKKFNVAARGPGRPSQK
jgi:hypothetical protein